MGKAALKISSPLPSPRKLPRQQRSQATVGYILEAARQLLFSEGAAAVTTRRVAERSGVAVGSLYQYFPNRDAILARLAEEEARRESKAIQEFFASVRKLPLAELLQRSIERVVTAERRMMALGGDFYQRHSRELQISQRAGRVNSGEVIDAGTLTVDTAHVLRQHPEALGETDTALAAYLLARGIPLMLGTLVAENPELLDSPQLSSMLARIVTAVIATDEPPSPD